MKWINLSLILYLIGCFWIRIKSHTRKIRALEAWTGLTSPDIDQMFHYIRFVGTKVVEVRNKEGQWIQLDETNFDTLMKRFSRKSQIVDSVYVLFGREADVEEE